MTKADYLHFRNQYIPSNTKVVFVLESPPISGRYFYNRDGALSEPLFRAMMKAVLEIAPASKEEGLQEFASRGFFLIDATYTPVNHCKGKERNAIILQDFPLLVEALREYAPRETGIVLVKANVCELLDARLIAAGFNVLNRGAVIPFPSTGQQSRFAERVRKVLGHAAEDVPRSRASSL
jgi:hypothetical protein